MMALTEQLYNWFRLHWLYLTLAVQAITLRLILHLPVYGPRLSAEYHKRSHMNESPIKLEDWIWSLCTYNAWLQECNCYRLDLFKKVSLNSKAVNANLYLLNGDQCKLLDFMKPGRPLVINFGSCS